MYLLRPSSAGRIGSWGCPVFLQLGDCHAQETMGPREGAVWWGFHYKPRGVIGDWIWMGVRGTAAMSGGPGLLGTGRCVHGMPNTFVNHRLGLSDDCVQGMISPVAPASLKGTLELFPCRPELHSLDTKQPFNRRTNIPTNFTTLFCLCNHGDIHASRSVLAGTVSSKRTLLL